MEVEPVIVAEVELDEELARLRGYDPETLAMFAEMLEAAGDAEAVAALR